MYEAMAGIGAEDVATIVYTSGTTGPPKGCELTHGNCLATVRMFEARLDLDPGTVIFTFLPLAHALARWSSSWGSTPARPCRIGAAPKRLLG